jgi:membrane carboxypeptidase/penicillin-binding protein
VALKMKKLRYPFFIITLVLVMLIVGYYTIEIINARNYTRNVVTNLLRSESLVLDIKDMSKRQLDILLAVEDPAFFEHNGMDLSTPGAGITTITQGLVKQFYFEKFQPGFAKIKQTLIAVFALDSLVSKQDQLRLFINYCYLGAEARGFEQAAQFYYGKPFKSLTEEEYLSLVAMIIAPATFNVRRFPKRNAERVKRIKKLVAHEYIPKGLFDLFYGKLDKNVQKAIPPLSYFESYYSE